MPNRIIREGILTSDRIDRLGCEAELFYRRLMSVVDDFGRFDARPTVLRVSCYPLRVDQVREADVSRWLAEVQSVGLIAVYSIDGKPFLEMIDFRQHVRARVSKYPARPPDAEKMHSTRTADASHVHSTRTAHARLDVDVDVDVDVKNLMSGSPVGDTDAAQLFSQAQPHARPQRPSPRQPVNGTAKAYAEAADVFDYLNTAAGKGFEFRRPDGQVTANGKLVLNLLKAGYTGLQLREVVLDRAERWRSDPKMFEFLRPNTLFAKSNFEAYLGEIQESRHVATG